VRESRQALNFRCSVRAARSLRAGRPLRAPQGAKISPSTQLQMFCSRCALTAGGPPTTSTARCEDLAKHSTSDVLFALRAHCGRPARYERRKVRGSRQALNFRCSFRAARSLRAGRPLRAPQGARISPSTQLQMFCSRCALTAGGPPALPVKSLSGQSQRTSEMIIPSSTSGSNGVETYSLQPAASALSRN